MTEFREPAPKDRVVFDHTFESMFFRALKGRVTSRLKQRLLELGVDLDHKLKPTYPRDAWVGSLHAAVEELFPDVPKDRAFFEVGERLIDSFRESLMGPAIEAVLKLVGPRRALHRLTQTFLYAANYQQAKVTELGPDEFEVWINEAGASPYFVAGAITAILRYVGAREPKVQIVHFDGHEVRYHIEL